MNLVKDFVRWGIYDQTSSQVENQVRHSTRLRVNGALYTIYGQIWNQVYHQTSEQQLVSNNETG